MKQLILLLAFGCAMPLWAQTSLTHNLQFDANDLTLTDTILDRTQYKYISLSGCPSYDEPGAPELPVKTIQFSVPYNADNFSITITNLQQDAIFLNKLPFPAQEPMPASINYIAKITRPNADYYATGGIYPQAAARVANVSFVGGYNKVVTVAVNPVLYRSNDNALLVNSSFTIKMQWDIVSDFSKSGLYPIWPRETTSEDSVTVTRLQRIVANPQSTARFAQNARSAQRIIGGGVTQVYPQYDYIIVTGRELAPAFERLAAYRKLKGFRTKVFCMEDILEDPNYKDGDDISGINDNAGKLRAFLRDAYQNNGTRYVLLGGKEPMVPIRYGWEYDNASYSASIIPTDLYFGELNSSWNKDNDNCYGEPSDNIDYSAELYIGRLTCTTLSEVHNYIDKLLCYELNPGNGDASYLKKSFTSIQHRRDINGSHEELFYQDYLFYMKEIMAQVYPDSTVVNGHYGYPDSTGSDIINLLNTSNYGFINFMGHGNPGAVKTSAFYIDVSNIPSYGINAINGYSAFMNKENGNGLDCLHNKNYLNWSYSWSCTTMPYDVYEGDGIGVYDDLPYNFGESYLLGKGYGGVAYLGNTRRGWFLGDGSGLQNIFFSLLREMSINEPQLSAVGVIEAKSKDIIFHQFSISHETRLTHNLLGDPLINLWIDEPIKARVSSEYVSDILFRGYRILPSADEYPIALSSTNILMGDILIPTTTPVTNSFLLSSFELQNNTLYVVHGKNSLPTILPMKMQGLQFKENFYIFAGNIYTPAVATISDGAIVSDISIEHDAVVVIESIGTVSLTSGLRLMQNGSLTIKSAGRVTLSNVDLQSGSILSVQAPEIEIGNNVSVARGAKLNTTIIAH